MDQITRATIKTPGSLPPGIQTHLDRLLDTGWAREMEWQSADHIDDMVRLARRMTNRQPLSEPNR
jgi:hypothetical protein